MHFITNLLCLIMAFPQVSKNIMFSLTSLLFSALFLGHLDPSERLDNAHPKLWCALNEGKVVVFDASTWSIQQHCFKMGHSKLVRLAQGHRSCCSWVCFCCCNPKSHHSLEVVELFWLQLTWKSGGF